MLEVLNGADGFDFFVVIVVVSALVGFLSRLQKKWRDKHDRT
jgi:hypothetical protein